MILCFFACFCSGNALVTIGLRYGSREDFPFHTTVVTPNCYCRFVLRVLVINVFLAIANYKVVITLVVNILFVITFVISAVSFYGTSIL